MSFIKQMSQCGIAYVLRTGIPWRDLPAQFEWHTIYDRFNRGNAGALWNKENRRLVVRYEKSDANFPGFVLLAFLVMLIC